MVEALRERAADPPTVDGTEPVSEVLARLGATLEADRQLVVVVAVQEPDRALAVLEAVRANSREDDARVLLRMAGLRQDSGAEVLYRSLRLRGRDDDLLAMVKARGRGSWWRPGIVRELRRSSIPEAVWQPLLGYSSVQTRYAAYLLLAFLVGLVAGVSGVGALLEWRVSTVFGSRFTMLVLVGLVPVFGLLVGLLIHAAGVAL